MPKAVKESDFAPHLPEALAANRWYLFCPGCFAHAKETVPDNERWWPLAALHCFNSTIHSFDGNTERPTLSPSLLVRSTHADGQPYCCHSFVRDGQIQFLDDCTHPLRGQTVDLLDSSILKTDD